MALSRQDVTDEFRSALKGQAGRHQQLKQVQLPRGVYQLARGFTTSVPLRDVHGALVRFISLINIYGLLSEKIGSRNVSEAEKEIGIVQEASEALLRYPMNLLLAPNRPEFRRLSVSVSVCVCKCKCNGDAKMNSKHPIPD